jgi:hypothetical protein
MSDEQANISEVDDEGVGASAPTPSALTRFLWFSAGADERLLQRCPASDWVKYQSIGGIVVATTVLAFVSASYAF